MKLPRWLVIVMLGTSVLSVLAAAGWWWVTWPDRTAQEFEDLIVRRKVDEAIAMIRSSDYSAPTVVAYLGRPGQDELLLDQLPRSWSDLCRGRREFRFRPNRFAHFTAERGRITELNTWSDVPLVRPSHR